MTHNRVLPYTMESALRDSSDSCCAGPHGYSANATQSSVQKLCTAAAQKLRGSSLSVALL